MNEAAQHNGKDVQFRERLDKAKVAMLPYMPSEATQLLPAEVLEKCRQAIADAEAWQTRVWHVLLHSSAEALKSASDELAGVAGGGAQGASWKAKLSQTATWEQVSQEAQYHLFDAE